MIIRIRSRNVSRSAIQAGYVADAESYTSESNEVKFVNLDWGSVLALHASSSLEEQEL